jgi:hypothetical protein
VSAPWVGKPSDEYRAVCGYSAHPGAPKCTSVATVHVMVRDDHYGPVGLAACDTHAATARTSGEWIAEHPFEGWCGLPGTHWVHHPVNRCELDDSGPDRVLTGVTAEGGQQT